MLQQVKICTFILQIRHRKAFREGTVKNIMQGEVRRERKRVSVCVRERERERESV